MIYGAKYSLFISFGSTLLGLIVGLALGAVAGYYGGLVDNIIMRVCDVLAMVENYAEQGKEENISTAPDAVLAAEVVDRIKGVAAADEWNKTIVELIDNE